MSDETIVGVMPNGMHKVTGRVGPEGNQAFVTLTVQFEVEGNYLPSIVIRPLDELLWNLRQMLEHPGTYHDLIRDASL